ncbi:MAG: Gfo/Idh/MocA family oxidoreductase [Planctomycetes bacterium]|nr:Gfo/Idh/MocA family oxidoreductase [Planctomycetota bacterium]
MIRRARYRVAVIGHTGRGNYGHDVDTVWLELPECEIVGVADADEGGLSQAVGRLRAPRGFRDYREMLDKLRPDIAAIGPRWLDQHRDMIVAAAEHGCHVFMEKPFCRTLDEADQIVAACERNRVKLAIAHQTRYSPKLKAVRDMIGEGAIGDVLELRARGKEDARGGGEDLWVLGSHLFNLIHVIGGEPKWCFADVRVDGRTAGPGDVREGNEGIGPLVGDSVQAMYGLARGAVAYFGSRKNANGGRFGLQVYGSKGVIEILTGHLPAAHFLADPAWSPGRTGANWIPISSMGPGREEPLADGGLRAGNVIACRDLLAAIEGDRLPECNVYEARATIEMILAVFASHRARAPVPIPLAPRGNPLADWR